MDLPIVTTQTTDDEFRKDLDETRRLCYMAQLASRTDRYNLAGTLVNALLHHQHVDADPETLKDHVILVIHGAGESSDASRFIRAQIDRITATLEA